MACPAGPTESTMLNDVLWANSSRCREGPSVNLKHGLPAPRKAELEPDTTTMVDSHPSRRPQAMGI
jgi:hypothetical protein